MLTIAPFAAAATLVCWSLDRWGGSLNPLNIAIMAFFGLFTVVVWPTYIPAIILAPLLMRRIASYRAFTALPLPLLVGLALLLGSVAGVCVLAPVVFLSLSDSRALVLNWVGAGAVSGALTLTVIFLIYRYVPRNG